MIENLLNYRFIEKEWLYPFDGVTRSDRIGISLDSLAKELEAQLAAGQDLQVWQLYDQLDDLATTQHNPVEIAEIKIICANVQSTIGRLPLARRDLIDAEKRFRGDHHAHAVVLWLLGIVCWQMGDSSQWEAISHWEESRRCFVELLENSHQPQERFKWYSDRRSEIDEFLKSHPAAEKSQQASAQPQRQVAPVESSAVNSTPPPTSDQSLNSGGGPIDQPPEADQQRPPLIPQMDFVPRHWLKSFLVLPGAVSAGPFKQTLEQNPDQFSQVLIPFVEIDDVLYDVVSLRGSKIIAWPGARTAYAIRVQGDSMDAYHPPILPGDYILVNPDIARHTGDVVVTQVINEDDTASNNVKLLVSITKDEILLRYQSKNPKYKRDGRDLEFSLKKHKHKNHEILGVAVALFSQRQPDQDQP